MRRSATDRTARLKRVLRHPAALMPALAAAFFLGSTLPASAAVGIDIQIAPPPPPHAVVVPPARPGWVWAPGYWRWDGGRHVWVEGRWLRERRGFHWVPEHWDEHHGRYHFVPGRWARNR